MIKVKVMVKEKTMMETGPLAKLIQMGHALLILQRVKSKRSMKRRKKVNHLKTKRAQKVKASIRGKSLMSH